MTETLNSLRVALLVFVNLARKKCLLVCRCKIMYTKYCPLKFELDARDEAMRCNEELCAWWGEYEGACVVFNISTALRIMTRNYGENE